MELAKLLVDKNCSVQWAIDSRVYWCCV